MLDKNFIARLKGVRSNIQNQIDLLSNNSHTHDINNVEGYEGILVDGGNVDTLDNNSSEDFSLINHSHDLFELIKHSHGVDNIRSFNEVKNELNQDVRSGLSAIYDSIIEKGGSVQDKYDFLSIAEGIRNLKKQEYTQENIYTKLTVNVFGGIINSNGDNWIKLMQPNGSIKYEIGDTIEIQIPDNVYLFKILFHSDFFSPDFNDNIVTGYEARLNIKDSSEVNQYAYFSVRPKSTIYVTIGESIADNINRIFRTYIENQSIREQLFKMN